MKKDGIQTRNRKLSSKKKKKGMLFPADMLRCDKTGAAGAAGGFGGFGGHFGGHMYSMYGGAAAASMAASMAATMAMGSGHQGGYHQPHPGMHGMSSLGLGGAAAPSTGPMGLGGGFCTVGA